MDLDGLAVRDTNVPTRPGKSVRNQTLQIKNHFASLLVLGREPLRQVLW